MEKSNKLFYALPISAFLVAMLAIALSLINSPKAKTDNSEFFAYQTTATIPHTSIESDNFTEPSTTISTTAEAVSTTAFYEITETTALSSDADKPELAPSQEANISVFAKSDSEILSILTEAINKTKAYKGNISIQHRESFDARVTQCTGGSIAAKVANSIVGMILKPTSETLIFSNGVATASNGDTFSILLPQKGEFRLQLPQIQSITAKEDNSDIVVNVVLKPESVGLNEIPVGNSAGLGYLDISSLDLSILTITSASLNYTGSTIAVHIRPDGYVSYAEYTIPMHVEGSAQSGLLNGSAVFDGIQTEVWDFNW